MSQQKSYTATLLGCGKMGGAMLRSWLDQDILSDVLVIDPTPLPASIAADDRVTHATNADQPIKSDLLILAVKPQILEESTEKIQDKVSNNTVILSIAAGKTIAAIEQIFDAQHPVVRAMPNTPAAIGKGASVAIANSLVSEAQKQGVTSLLKALGTLEWIENEPLMNAVTALSGSGPAYIFHLIEILAQSGQSVGLDKDLAMTLARQTVIGSAALAEHDKDTPASTLRENVTSPKGTTEAALKVLMDGRAQEIFNEALNAAKKRGEELNS